MKKANIALLCIAILWGSSFAFQKEIFGIISPTLFTFYNFLITGSIFFFVALYKKQNLFYRIKEGVILGLLITGMELTQMYGLYFSTAANTSFISNIGMLLIPYLGFVMYRHTVSWTDTLAIVGAGVGMFFLVGGLDGVSFGDIYLVCSAFFMAFYFLLSQTYEKERSSHISVLCAQQFFTVSFVTGVITLLLGETFTVPSASLFHLLVLVVMFTVLPYALIQWSSKYSTEMTVSMYDGVVEPLIGAVVSWVIFLEATSTSKVLGGMLMIFSFVFASLFSKRHFLREYIREYFS